MKRFSFPMLVKSLLALACVLATSGVSAAPEAHILRLDPRASRSSGDPIITMVAEIAQSRRVSDALAPCATQTGDAALACMADALEKPFALYQSVPFPKQSAIFTVTVDDADRPAKLMSAESWGQATNQPGVGTAWLVLIDADRRMEGGFSDAKQVAGDFVDSLGPNDIVDVRFFDEREVVEDSKWMPASARSRVLSFIQRVAGTYPGNARSRALPALIKTAATDGFTALGNVSEAVTVPLHQAMVVLSSGYGGTGAGALKLRQYMTGGRFPEDNTELPKTPVPVISVYFPMPAPDESRRDSLDFMESLTNPEMGGFFDVVPAGQGARGANIVRAVRTRFSTMQLIKWRVSCVAPTATQTFGLVFSNVNPPILGDNSFKDAPIGIDPTAWPLDVDIASTQAATLAAGGIYPGGKLKVYGDFCWGGDTTRVEAYFLPAGHATPKAPPVDGADREKGTQQRLMAEGMRGTATEAADTYAEFDVPDNDKLVHGSGDQAVAAVIIYDNKARRTSGMTADTILQVKATAAPFPMRWVLAGVLATGALALLSSLVLRRGAGRNRGAVSPSPPPIATVYAPNSPGPDYATRATLHGQAGNFSVPPGSELRAGRDAAECAIVLSDPRVSSVHASFKLENGQLLIRDEGSDGGTFVDGVQCSRGFWTRVPHGGSVRLAAVELSVRLA